jgi:hypothetical protein
MQQGALAVSKYPGGRKIMHTPELSFTQKRVSARTRFAFGEHEFTYGLTDRTSAREVSADYFQVGGCVSRIKRPDRSGVGLAILIFLVGLAVLAIEVWLGILKPWSPAWLLPGMILTGLILTRKIRYTVFQVAGEPVLIIEDKRLPKIVAELETRRRARLAELYGPLNLANDPRLEIRKIEWLVAESVMTREQADQQIAQVQNARAPRPTPGLAVAQESAAN